MRIALVLAAALLLSVAVAAPASAENIGYFGPGGATSATASGVVTGLGHTFSTLTDLTAADLAGLDVLWVLNSSNSSNPTSLISNSAAVAAWVSNGGCFVYHDRYVDGATAVLPGGAGFSIVRDFSDDTNIDVLDGSTLVTNGPGGVITDTSLDGGTSSSHGYSVAGSLPGSAALILSRTADDEIVDMSYSFGNGGVYYSTMPLDFYFGGSGPAAVRANFNTICAPNVIAYAVQGNKNAIPEPGSLALFGLGALGVVLVRRRRRTAA